MPAVTADQISVRVQTDAKYIYFLVEGLDERPGNNRINLALDVTPKSGIGNASSVEFGREADFLIRIGAEGGSGLYVDAAYDLLPYSALGKYPDATMEGIQAVMRNDLQSQIHLEDNPDFVLVSRADGNIYTRLSARWLINPVGTLAEGNTDPSAADYAPRADYCFAPNAVEIRIPWQLLNFRDPSACEIVDDLEENHLQIRSLPIEEFQVAAFYDDAAGPLSFGSVALEGWEQPVWHERLKDSYYILQDAFEAVN